MTIQTTLITAVPWPSSLMLPSHSCRFKQPNKMVLQSLSDLTVYDTSTIPVPNISEINADARTFQWGDRGNDYVAIPVATFDDLID